jgi:hypothetical protein
MHPLNKRLLLALDQNLRSLGGDGSCLVIIPSALNAAAVNMIATNARTPKPKPRRVPLQNEAKLNAAADFCLNSRAVPFKVLANRGGISAPTGAAALARKKLGGIVYFHILINHFLLRFIAFLRNFILAHTKQKINPSRKLKQVFRKEAIRRAFQKW